MSIFHNDSKFLNKMWEERVDGKNGATLEVK